MRSESQKTFHAVRFALAGLTDWLGPIGFTGGVQFPGSAYGEQQVEMKFKGTKKTFALTPDITMKVLNRYRGPIAFNGMKKIVVGEEGLIELEFAKPQSVKALFREILIWQAFVTLATNRPSYIKGMSVSGSDLKYGAGVIFPGMRREDESDARNREILFSYGRLGAKLGPALSKWRRGFDVLETPFTVFAGTFFQTDAFIHTKLLAYLQAIEVLHRKLHPGGRFTNDLEKAKVVQALKSAVPQTLPEETWQSIANYVQQVGEWSLLDRLKALYGVYPKTFGSLFPNGVKDLRELRDVRNYLTHYSDQSRFDADYPTSPALVKLAARAKLFLEVCLLGILGLKDEEIHTLMQDYEPFQDART